MMDPFVLASDTAMSILRTAAWSFFLLFLYVVHISLLVKMIKVKLLNCQKAHKRVSFKSPLKQLENPLGTEFTALH